MNQFEEVEIGKLCTIKTRSSDYYLQSEMVGEHEGAMIIAPSNINNSKLNFDDVRYYSWKGYYEKQNLIVENGDIVLCKYSASSYYKSAVVEDLPEPAITNMSIFLFKNIKCNPYYLQLVISSSAFQALLWKNKSGTMNAIKSSDILTYKIPLPSMDEQKRIVESFLKYRNLNSEIVDSLRSEADKREKQFDCYLDKAIWGNK